MKLKGRYGQFGGFYVPEVLIPALEEIEAAFECFSKDPRFVAELDDLYQHYAGRPTPLYHAKRFSEHVGFQVWLNQSLGLLIVVSFAPFIDMWGHFGGMLMGLGMAWFYKPLPLSQAEQQAAAQLLAEEAAAAHASEAAGPSLLPPDEGPAEPESPGHSPQT